MIDEVCGDNLVKMTILIVMTLHATFHKKYCIFIYQHIFIIINNKYKYICKKLFYLQVHKPVEF